MYNLVYYFCTDCPTKKQYSCAHQMELQLAALAQVIEHTFDVDPLGKRSEHMFSIRPPIQYQQKVPCNDWRGHLIKEKELNTLRSEKGER